MLRTSLAAFIGVLLDAQVTFLTPRVAGGHFFAICFASCLRGALPILLCACVGGLQVYKPNPDPKIAPGQQQK